VKGVGCGEALAPLSHLGCFCAGDVSEEHHISKKVKELVPNYLCSFFYCWQGHNPLATPVSWEKIVATQEKSQDEVISHQRGFNPSWSPVDPGILVAGSGCTK
jgi:hypothetical protein